MFSFLKRSIYFGVLQIIQSCEIVQIPISVSSVFPLMFLILSLKVHPNRSPVLVHCSKLSSQPHCDPVSLPLLFLSISGLHPTPHCHASISSVNNCFSVFVFYGTDTHWSGILENVTKFKYVHICFIIRIHFGKSTRYEESFPSYYIRSHDNHTTSLWC